MSEKCPKASPAFLFGKPPEFATEIIDLTWQKPRMSLDDSNPPPFPPHRAQKCDYSMQ